MEKTPEVKPFFEVVTPSYANPDELQELLNALEAQSFRAFRLWVCLDGPCQPSLQMLNAARVGFEMQVRQHLAQQHRGRAATRNLPLFELSAPYTVFVDSDLRPRPQLLAAFARRLAQGATPAALQGRVRYTNAAQNLWARYVQARGAGKANAGQPLPWYHFATGCVCVPTAWLQEARGFDEAFQAYGGEDTELGWRLGKSPGRWLEYLPDALAEGEFHMPLSDALQRWKRYGATGWAYLLKQHPDLALALPFNPFTGSGIKARLLRGLLSRRFRPAIHLLALLGSLQAMAVLAASFLLEGYRSSDQHALRT